MSYNRNSDEALENELSVYAKGKPNREICQQMADALVGLCVKKPLVAWLVLSDQA